jgi:hypothetical protein
MGYNTFGSHKALEGKNSSSFFWSLFGRLFDSQIYNLKSRFAGAD